MPAAYTVSYTSIEKMQIAVPDLGSVTTLTSAHLFDFAGQAESEINAQLARLYALPLAVDVPLLTTLATDIAVYRVLTRRIFTAERLANSPWPDRYKESLAQLLKVAEGAIPLVDSSGTVLQGRTDIAEVWSTTKDYHPTFWDGGPPGTDIIDPDKIDDGATDRDLGQIRDRLL